MKSFLTLYWKLQAIMNSLPSGYEYHDVLYSTEFVTFNLRSFTRIELSTLYQSVDAIYLIKLLAQSVVQEGLLAIYTFGSVLFPSLLLAFQIPSICSCYDSYHSEMTSSVPFYRYGSLWSNTAAKYRLSTVSDHAQPRSDRESAYRLLPRINISTKLRAVCWENRNVHTLNQELESPSVASLLLVVNRLLSADENSF
ncbi:hypothetical protein BDQ12DRAFT_671215 [Crucibulum laeve]|uniref:Uncharacterized protein n=1 Tax=Crucibulum laeve TaxID=68775 RepID=A0A5C3LGL4_9AGAR|nr:hypothetical protein BDQ12DRAFT_671215 [Crucibulum laeve]